MKQLFALVVSFAFFAPLIARAEEASEAPMPQLDSTYYASQLFWLAVCGVVMYALMAKIALPQVARMVDQRDDQVRHDLELAYKLRQQAEEIKVVYTKALRDADEKAKAVIDTLAKDIKAKQEKALAEAGERMQSKIAQTETYLRGEKDVLLRDLNVYAAEISEAVWSRMNQREAA